MCLQTMKPKLRDDIQTSEPDLGVRTESERGFWNALYSCWEKERRPFQTHNLVDHWDFLNALIEREGARCILSVGGGVDRRAIELARRGARVTVVDVSDVAIHKTRELARLAGVASNVEIVQAACETLDRC